MRFTTRMAVLAAAVSLPLGAALASYALADDPSPPDVPPGVRIGESNQDQRSTTTTTTPVAPPPATPPPATPLPAPHTEVVPHAPPVTDDDDDDDDDDGGGGGGDDDGDD